MSYFDTLDSETIAYLYVFRNNCKILEILQANLTSAFVYGTPFTVPYLGTNLGITSGRKIAKGEKLLVYGGVAVPYFMRVKIENT